MLKFVKNSTLQFARALGAFEIASRSCWRQRRLLILCYHGLSLRDEDRWSNLYVSPAFFRRRLEILARCRYQVLPLNDAVEMLRASQLPPKSVVITFDDGFYDFYERGFPMLREFGFPATVYQTTHYCDHPFPVFDLVLSYVLWRGTGRRFDGAAFSVPGGLDVSGDPDHNGTVAALVDFARRQEYTFAQKNGLAARLAGELGVDYAEILRLGMLRSMTADQISEVARAGVDIQLHTHRHMTPLDKDLFAREIRDNRQWLVSKVGTQPNHFCYPNGHCHDDFLPWLRSQNIVSATTSDSGMATRTSEPLLLPRLMDSMLISDAVFEGWLAGVSSFLPRRRI